MKFIVKFLESFITKTETKFFSVDSALKEFEKVKTKLEKVAEYQREKCTSSWETVYKATVKANTAERERTRALNAMSKINEFLA